jgi:hypothetical protein
MILIPSQDNSAFYIVTCCCKVLKIMLPSKRTWGLQNWYSHERASIFLFWTVLIITVVHDTYGMVAFTFCIFAFLVEVVSIPVSRLHGTLLSIVVVASISSFCIIDLCGLCLPLRDEGISFRTGTYSVTPWPFVLCVSAPSEETARTKVGFWL